MTDAAFNPMTAESMPIIRKGFKVFGMIAFGAVWFSAMAMTFSVMLDRGKDDAWWVTLGLVTLGIGADFWVGAGPVILRSSASWGVKGWVWIGGLTLAGALAFSFSNKVAYWVERSDSRQIAAIEAKVDVLADDRALVAANPATRLPAAVKGEISAIGPQIASAQQAIAAKDQEISGLAADWPNRIRRANRERVNLVVEKGRLEARRGALAAEYETAVAVAGARMRIAAAAKRDAVAVADVGNDKDAMAQFVIDANKAVGGKGMDEAAALVVLHTLFSLFHELAQFSFLGLATLRIPLHKMEEEQRFIIGQKRLRAEKRAELLRVRIEENTKVRAARAEWLANKASIDEIVTARADLETSKQRREVVRERRFLERLWKIEDDELAPIPEHMRLNDKRHEGEQAVDKGAIEAEWKDAMRSEAAKRGWSTRRRKVNVGGREFETEGVKVDEGAVDDRTPIMDSVTGSQRHLLDMMAKQAESAAERRALRKLAEQASNEAPAKRASLNVEEPETVAEPEPEMETVAVAEPEAPAPVEPEPAAEPEAPLILSDETVEALEGAGIVKDGELPDQFVTAEGDLDTEAVREHMSKERGLPAPREDAEAA